MDYRRVATPDPARLPDLSREAVTPLLTDEDALDGAFQVGAFGKWVGPLTAEGSR